MWHELKLGNIKVKYTPLEPDTVELKDCDKDGNILKRISGSFEKGYLINEQTGERHEKAFKLVNGKASEGFKGRIKEVEKPIYVEQSKAEDIIIEKEYLVESEELYNELLEKKQALLFGGYFGNGFKAYKCYVSPSPLYRGFLIMRCGRQQLSEKITNIVSELKEYRRLTEKLKEIELATQTVNKTKVEDLIQI